MTWIVLIALGGVAAYYMMMGSGKRFECPSCDLYINGARASKGDSVLCSHCREYGLYDGQKLVKMPPDTLSGRFIFCTELPMEAVRWPARCPVCTEPATRAVPLQITIEQDSDFGTDMATRMATMGMFKAVNRHTFSIDVPHCAQHSDGATLMMPYERAQPNIGLGVRSYPYFLEFKTLNHSTPRKASLFGGENEQGV